MESHHINRRGGLQKYEDTGAAHTVLANPVTGVPNGGGMVVQAVPDHESTERLAAQWNNFVDVYWAGGDFVTIVPGLNGQAIVALSGSPLTAGESSCINVGSPVYQPCSMQFAGDFVRTGISFATASMFANDPLTGPDPVPESINIVSISQSSAVLGAAYTGTAGSNVTIVLESPVPKVGSNAAVYAGDWGNITGLVDNRLCYPNACINFISLDRKTICVGFSDEAALPSIAVPVINPPLGTAKFNFYNNFGGARNAFGLRFTGTSATSAAVVSIFGGDDNQVSGVLLGDHRATIGSSAPVYAAGAAWGQYEIRPSTRYLLECTQEAAVVLDKPEQLQASWTPRDVPRTSVKPASGAALLQRFRLYKPVSMSRPVAKIIKAEKLAASSVATFYIDRTCALAGIVTGKYYTFKGMRDFAANFPATTTPVQVTVTGVNTFTAVVGAAVIATTFGGAVIETNGGRDQPGVIAQVVQSVQSRVAEGGNCLELIGSAAWVGLNPGDYIDPFGLCELATGADIGVDGVWEVVHISTVTMVVAPVFDVFGRRVSPDLGVLPLTNCGGAVILRPTLRCHDFSAASWSESKFSLDGQGTLRLDKAMPIYGMGGTFTASQGPAAAASTTDGSGGWLIRPGITGIADIASAALTTTTTSAAISNAMGNGFQVTVPVTGVTGSSPTLDIRIEESYEGGQNWRTLYDMERITANGSYNTPILRASGRHIRYVRTVGGGTPSFTHSLTRNLLPFIQAEPQKRLIDRSIVMTTLNSTTPVLFSGTANNIQLVLKLGAATTPPSIQIEGSEDGQTGWYAIGAPLAGVASGTVQLTVNGMSATHIRARVSTAGVAVTPDYVSLKAWS